MQRSVLLVPFLLAALPAVAIAQDGERYRLERTENGFVRMDTQTGRMSFCTDGSGELVCRDAGGEGRSEQDRIEALAERVEALERRLAALEGGGTNSLPSEEEFEQTMSFMERFLRRFMGIVKDLESETAPGEEPVPDRT